MSPLLPGIIASGISGHLTPPYSPIGDYEALATFDVGSGVGEVIFAGIPQGYKHLEIYVSARDSRTPVTYGNILMQYNGDTATNYSIHAIFGDSRTGMNEDSGYNAPYLVAANAPGAASLTNSFASSIIKIRDYANANVYKTHQYICGYDSNTTGYGGINCNIAIGGGNWRNLNPIQSIRLYAANTPIAAGSHFTLFGVK